MDKKFLGQAYNHSEKHSDTMNLYDEWAKHYDAEVTDNGYATPKRCAIALNELGADNTAPILDIGCGTGISGQALHDAGFHCIDGTDMNANMLAQAKLERGTIYRSLKLVDMDNPFPFAIGAYRHIAAMGVIAARHAPATTISTIIDLLPVKGLFVFSLNDHTLEDVRYEAEVAANVEANKIDIAYRQYGPHLPGINMGSVIYVLRRK